MNKLSGLIMPWYCTNCQKNPETLVWPVTDHTHWRGTNVERGKEADYVDSLEDVYHSEALVNRQHPDYLRVHRFVQNFDGYAEFGEEPAGCGECGSRDIEWQ